MAVACPTSFASSMALDAPFAEELDRASRVEAVSADPVPASGDEGAVPGTSLAEALLDEVLAAPGELRDAPTAPGGADVAWDLADSQPPPLADRGPEWCVDLGEEMIALHAVDLYMRLATRALRPDVMVWRCGREAWTPARDVPELRYAVEDAEGSDADPVVDVRGEVDADDELLDALAFAQAE